jgi:hypothetical protein
MKIILIRDSDIFVTLPALLIYNGNLIFFIYFLQTGVNNMFWISSAIMYRQASPASEVVLKH